jgi:uncharacterized Zn finger protein
MDKEITRAEIRLAQSEIALKMAGEVLKKRAVRELEQASLHLRNLEQLLASSPEQALIVSLKGETLALHSLAEEMQRTSKRLSGITDILRKIVKKSGQIIDILELAK